MQGKCLDIRAGEFVGLGQKLYKRRIDAVVIAVRPGTGSGVQTRSSSGQILSLAVSVMVLRRSGVPQDVL